MILLIIRVTLAIATNVCLLIANTRRFIAINQAIPVTVFVLLRDRMDNNVFILRNLFRNDLLSVLN